MFSFLGAKARVASASPSAASTATIKPSNAEAASNIDESSDGLTREAAVILNLQRENKQLRQELEDAHYRIRTLEFNLSVFITAADDDASVEVQSTTDISMTSSMTTLPTGTPLANEKREEQRRRDEVMKLRNNRNASKRKHRFYNRISGKKNPLDLLSQESSITDPKLFYRYNSDDFRLDRSYSSMSESDASEAYAVDAGRGFGTASDSSWSTSNKVSVLPYDSSSAQYLLRVQESTDDDDDGSDTFGEI